jgi:hypothetical protein
LRLQELTAQRLKPSRLRWFLHFDASEDVP